MDLPVALAELASVAAACAQAAQTDAATAADDRLLDFQKQLAASARLVEVAAAALAAEVAHRSRPELGYNGLAQKRGARTPAALVQQLTGTSAPTAHRLVRVGTMVAEVAARDSNPGAEVAEPWLAPLVRAAGAGLVSAEAVDVVRLGLGSPSEGVSATALTDAACILALEAAEGVASMTIERLAARARELRDELDSSGVVQRENERRERRSLRLYPQPDGMTRISGLLDPESAATIKNALDLATSPRRGGPRFVDADEAARAERVTADPRTDEQLALDALVELVDVAVRARGSKLLGVRRADVRVLVAQRDLDRRSGVAFVEGQRASVSVATAERHACDGGLLPVLFAEDGSALNLGQAQRFHTAPQRAVISARDGGCLHPDCDRPPSWCEVHHINEYSLGGETSVDDGVLLCRHHHLLVHNNHWRVRRTRGADAHRYELVPPPDVDVRRQPIPMPTKSAALRRTLAHA